MLVLTRRVGEKIIITTPSGERIVVSVAQMGREGKVRLGIEANREVMIHREEIQQKLDELDAAKGTGNDAA